MKKMNDLDYLNKPNATLVMLPPWGVQNPPIGLASISSYLKSKNINARILDLNIEVFNKVPQEQKALWESKNLDNWRLEDNFRRLLLQGLQNKIDYCIKKILSVNNNVLGFSINRANLRFTIEVVKHLREINSDLKIIFGGHSCSIEGERKLVPEELIDVFVVGEGEETFYEILKHLNEGKSLGRILGVLAPGSNRFTPRLRADLNLIPYPTYEQFDLDKYDITLGGLPVVTSRGCPRRCVICNDIVAWGYKFRYRKAQHVFDEIKHHVEKYKVNFFEFTDSSCNGNLSELKELSELLINSKYRIKWIANMMIKPDVDYELLRKMKDSGCELLRYGVESGSDKILKAMNKSFTVKIAEKALKESHKAGIKNHINLIVGFPGEGEKEFNETIDFLKRNKDYITNIANIFSCFLTPGSKIEQDYKKYEITLPDNNYAVNWYDRKGNTFLDRQKKIKRLTNFIRKLGIKLDDSGVWLFDNEAYFKKKKLFADGITIDYSIAGKCKAYFKDKEVTKDIGLNTSFYDGIKWTDASSAIWNIGSDSRDNHGRINIKWPRYPIIQNWHIEVVDNSLYWDVETSFEREISIFQYKIGIMLSNKFNKYILGEKSFDFSPSNNNQWRELIFNQNCGIKLIGTKRFIDLIISSYGDAYLQLQDPPTSLGARMVNFCLFPRRRDYDEDRIQKRIFNKRDKIKKRIKINFQ